MDAPVAPAAYANCMAAEDLKATVQSIVAHGTLGATTYATTAEEDTVIGAAYCSPEV